MTAHSKKEILQASEKITEAIAHLGPPYRLLALAHAIGLTLVSSFPPDQRADTLQKLCDGPCKGALREYEHCERRLDEERGPRQ